MSLIQRMVMASAFSGISFGLYQAMQGNIFLEKGLFSWQLGIVFAVLGLSTALFEIPLGTIADNYGRLKIYRLSIIIKIIALSTLFFGFGFIAVVIYAFFSGLSSAVATGTSDAWLVEEVKRQGNEKLLSKYMSYLQLATLFSMVIFSFAAGYIVSFLDSSGISDSITGTNWVIGIMLVLTIIYFFLSFYFYKEGEDFSQRHQDGKVSFIATFKKAIENIKSSNVIIEVMILTISLMMMVAVLEAYWQPRIYELVPDTSYHIFGYITAGYFLTQLVGGVIASVIASSQKINKLYFSRAMVLLSACNLVILSFMAQITGFIAFYFIFVFAPMLSNPFLFALIHSETNDENRSTLVSIESFIISLVVGVELLIVPYIIKYIGISSMFTVMGVLVFTLIIITSYLFRASKVTS